MLMQTNKRPSISLLIGSTNTGAFASGGASGLAISITNITGPDFLITAFTFLYKTGQDEAELELIDVQQNRPIILGSTQFCTVGAVKGSAIVLPRLKLETPFIIKSGQRVDLNIRNNSATNIVARDLALTLYGKQFI